MADVIAQCVFDCKLSSQDALTKLQMNHAEMQKEMLKITGSVNASRVQFQMLLNNQRRHKTSLNDKNDRNLLFGQVASI